MAPMATLCKKNFIEHMHDTKALTHTTMAKGEVVVLNAQK